MKPWSPDSRERLRAALLAWYRTSARDLPWRRTRDPWGVWISEVMLQQTTVATVTARWPRFLARFPTVEALANAPLDAVLEEWRGLGYYARARHLHRAAQVLAARGALPGTAAEWRAIPGVGEYTAAAIASIVHGEPVAVFDANVRRVLARLRALELPADSGAGRVELQRTAQELLDPRHPSEFNQGLMELGATVCLPREARCEECPLSRWCGARAAGTPLAWPRLAAKAPLVPVREVAVALWRGERLLVLRRPARGSFANFWELPRVELLEHESPEDGARRAARELCGLAVTRPRATRERTHTVMRRRITLFLVEGRCRAGTPTLAEHMEFRWLTPKEWSGLPSSTTQHELAVALAGKAGGRI